MVVKEVLGGVKDTIDKVVGIPKKIVTRDEKEHEIPPLTLRKELVIFGKIMSLFKDSGVDFEEGNFANVIGKMLTEDGANKILDIVSIYTDKPKDWCNENVDLAALITVILPLFTGVMGKIGAIAKS